MLGERGVVVEGDGLAQAFVDAAEYGEHGRDGLGGGLSHEPRDECHTGLALMQDEHGPHALADDEIALPMASLATRFYGFGPIVD